MNCLTVELISTFTTAVCESWNVSGKYTWDNAGDLKQLFMDRTLKPGLHISRKDRKQLFGNMFFWLSTYGLVSISLKLMITSIDVSQKIVTMNILKALKSSLKHYRKQVLRLLQLYGDQA